MADVVDAVLGEGNGAEHAAEGALSVEAAAALDAFAASVRKSGAGHGGAESAEALWRAARDYLLACFAVAMTKDLTGPRAAFDVGREGHVAQVWAEPADQ